YSYTPESVREEIIDGYVTQELIRQEADARGITIDSDTVDQYVESMKSNYSTDEAWEDALEAAGMTEDEYRENIELSLMASELQTALGEETEVTDEEVLEYAQNYASTLDGAKRSSHILFSDDDYDEAVEVLDELRNGEIDFADAAEEYSIDTGSASQGGDVGWDALSSFVTEYQDAVDGLEVGEISDIVESDYGYHIITVTDEWTAPDEITSLDQLPDEFVDSFRSSLESSNASSAYSEWLSEARDSADIVINDMPEGLPYDVDMSAYETEEEEEEIDESTDEAVDIELAEESGEEVEQVDEEGDVAGQESSDTTVTEEDADNTETVDVETTEAE
ncbi:MAG: peptidylprolyl isomerase, partial [Eggerthellaceae bacterium]|nr:peptidylprolyl isomerase [Eggerthellaceae bacterium]